METGDGYNESDTINKSNLTIEADASQDATPVLDGLAPTRQSAPGFTIESGVTGVTIAGLTIQNFSVYPDSAGGIENGGMLTVANCTISDNSAAYYGGGIENKGTMTITSCTIEGNSANLAGGAGGGISAPGMLTIDDSTINNNTADNAGGIFVLSGDVTINSCTIDNNSGNSQSGNGGGIDNDSTLSITNSTISGNSAGLGGGINNAGDLTVNNCLVSDNSAIGTSSVDGDGGGIDTYNNGIVTITESTISNNTASFTGGGIENDDGTLTVTESTISGNSSGFGAGICNDSGTTVVDSTISGNLASNMGGGVWNDGTLAINDSTIALNNVANAGYGGGVYVSSGTATLDNTIVALNTSGTGTSADDIDGTVTSASAYNLIGTGGSGGLSNGKNGNQVGVANPLLGSLGNYGGPTETIPLLPGSPAIGAGSNALIPAGVTTDQRGLPRIVNGIVDIGAFESSGFTITVTSGSGQSTGVLTAFSAPLVVTVTANNPSEPVAGGLVTFTPPPSGASATLSGSPATISATGTASVTATANGIVGSYTVAATASGITTPASFSLTNNPASPTINTSQQPASATVGSTIADKATVSGGDNPTGTVTFNLYNNSTGTGTPLFTDTETLVSGVATSAGYTATATGTDYWVATYNGNSNNAAVSSGTASEPVTVSQAAPSSVYVNSAWAGDASGTAVTWTDGSTHYVGEDAFGTIQAGVDGVASGGTVNVAAGTYTETDAIAQNVTIDGAGASLVTVNGQSAGSVFTVDSGVTATLSGLTITGGNAAGGGGIDNNGTLTVTNCTIEGNSADAGAEAGESLARGNADDRRKHDFRVAPHRLWASPSKGAAVQYTAGRRRSQTAHFPITPRPRLSAAASSSSAAMMTITTSTISDNTSATTSAGPSPTVAAATQWLQCYD